MHYTTMIDDAMHRDQRRDLSFALADARRLQGGVEAIEAELCRAAAVAGVTLPLGCRVDLRRWSGGLARTLGLVHAVLRERLVYDPLAAAAIEVLADVAAALDAPISREGDQ